MVFGFSAAKCHKDIQKFIQFLFTYLVVGQIPTTDVFQNLVMCLRIVKEKA